MIPRLKALPVCLLLFSCTSDDRERGLCTLILEPAIEVEVRDASSLQPLAAYASGQVRDGEFVEALEVTSYESTDPSSAYLMAAAYERPGIYDVTVDVEGYRPWSESDVEVVDDGCHVVTRRLLALMEQDA